MSSAKSEKSEKSKTPKCYNLPQLSWNQANLEPNFLLVISFEILLYIPMLPTQMQWIKGQEIPPCKYFWGVLVIIWSFGASYFFEPRRCFLLDIAWVSWFGLDILKLYSSNHTKFLHSASVTKLLTLQINSYSISH